MTRGVRDRYRAPLRSTEQRESVKAGRIHDRFEVGYEIVQRHGADVAVREAAAARVVAVEMMARAQGFQPGAPYGGLPVPLQVRHPVAGPHQRKAPSTLGKSDLHAVGGGGEPDLLAKGRHAAVYSGKRTSAMPAGPRYSSATTCEAPWIRPSCR